MYRNQKSKKKETCHSYCVIPLPPRLPRNFRWCGRYVVPDLNITTPFTWNGNNGDTQMIAGNIDYPIWFTNFIIRNCIYTYTFKWPGLNPENFTCEPLPFSFSIDDLNALFARSHFVGPEILEDNGRYIKVNHFRLSIVLQLSNPGPGAYPRLPITSADIYVDRDDSTRIVKILHFGLQNLYDPNLDEWIIIDHHEDCPGEIIIPPMCQSCPNTSPQGGISSSDTLLTSIQSLLQSIHLI
jgi:hypothetical protein